jgi:hypothetical protein
MRDWKSVHSAVQVFAVIGGTFCLPGLIAGGGLILDWARLQTPTAMYFSYPYFAAGVAWTGASLVGIGATWYSFTRRRFYGIGALLALVIGSWEMASLPGLNPRVQMLGQVTSLLGHADHSLAAWDETHDRFPTDETELLDALSRRPQSEARLFYVGRRELPYTVKMVANATGPYVGSLPERPGVFVYAVRKDFLEYWITVTTLDRPVGGQVVFHRAAGNYKNGEVWVISRTHRQHGQPQKGFVE